MSALVELLTALLFLSIAIGLLAYGIKHRIGPYE